MTYSLSQISSMRAALYKVEADKPKANRLSRLEIEAILQTYILAGVACDDMRAWVLDERGAA